MIQTIFLDTNVILDYLENRNPDVRDIVAQLLLFHKKGAVVLATSVFNIAELIDKEFQIHHIGTLLSNKMSYDEVLRKKDHKKEYREDAKRHKAGIEKKIRKFIFENEIRILDMNLGEFTDDFSRKEFSSYEELYNLIYSHQFSSQDAIIIGTAICNGTVYFLSNDNDVVQQVNLNNLIDAYNLREPNQRDEFKNNVLETLVKELR